MFSADGRLQERIHDARAPSVPLVRLSPHHSKARGRRSEPCGWMTRTGESEAADNAHSDTIERRFLDYAKRKARASLDNEFLFSDIAPILTSAPGVAAQAFHRECC